VPHRIVAEELELLDEVTTLLQEEPYVVPPSQGEIVEELIRLREEMATAKAEDRGSLMSQYDQQLSLLEQIRRAARAPQVDPGSPYFAHMRLREGERERDLCLGKATRIQRGVRIIDWRNAPISQVFYRYQQGDEYEEHLGDRMFAGELVARRTVAIRNGELVRIDGPEGTFRSAASGCQGWHHVHREPPRLAGGEGAALRAHRHGEGTHRRLGTDLHGARRRADKRLPDIAGLIDAEQFELITRPTSGFVVIRGTAGSGKTTVALHRIAWMAYEDPRVDSPRTMFAVFSQALRDYVSHVLPALGVHSVDVRTFAEWSAQQRRRHFPALPRAVREDTPGIVVRLKLHPVLLAAFAEQVARVDGQPTREQAIDDWVSVTTDAALLKAVVAREAPGAFSDTEIDRATTWCRDRCEEVLAWLAGDRDIDAELDVEDDALLLRAWQQRVGPLRNRRRRPLVYRHIAVDEVQDFSPLEVRVLLDCLDKRKSITLAGDTQQHVMQNAGFTSWTAFFDHLGVEGTEVSTLRVAYRSSRQIVDFALAVLGDLVEDDEPPLTTREGPPVELFQFTDHGACVAFLADALKELIRDEPLASVAVLTTGSDLSAIYTRGLLKSEVPRLRQVLHQDFTFAPGVEVTEVDQVKGLEFDYVVLVEVSAERYPDTDASRRLLNVGATRAVHQLWLTTVGTASSLVREVMQLEGR